MPVYNLSRLESSSTASSAPLCVVGAGIAGLLLARRVAQRGQKVIVLESGYAHFDEAIHGLNEIEDLAGRYSRALTGRYRGLGGTSTRWGGRMIPISEHEAEARRYLPQPAWPFPMEQLKAHQAEIERLFGVGEGPYEGKILERIDKYKYFPRGDPYMLPRWAKCPDFKKCNIATLIREDIKNLKDIEIWLGATVCAFGLDRIGGKLTSVRARDLNGKELEVRAGQFVISAGTIETTRLLLLMDEASDKQAFEGCQVLGRYFQDHLKSDIATICRCNPTVTNNLFGYRFLNSTRRDLHLELSEAAQREDKVASAFAYVAMDLTESPLAYVKRLAHGIQRRELEPHDLWRASRNLGLLARAAYWRFMRDQLFVPASVDFHLIVCAEQLPQWSNRIRLSDKRDRLGMPKARLEWSPTPTDERTFRSAVAHIAGYWKRAGFDRICPLNWTAASSDASMPIIEQAEACAHPSGSTRMGTNPSESVVGPNLRCHAIPNVSVVSASVFPTAGSANPTFTIMQLALWWADSYLQRATSLAAALA